MSPPGVYARMFCMNELYYGDCLTIMQDLAPASVDLIYLDPPFNSKRDYNAIYKDGTGRPLPDLIENFEDVWTLDNQRERAIRQMPIQMRAAGLDDAAAEFLKTWMGALRKTQPSLLAYLSYMAERLVLMRGILKPTGSIYLHCDPTASHYLKALMDAIFGHGNFQNEVIWKRTGAHGGANRWGPVHDVLLFYSKGAGHTWNRVYQDYDPSYLEDYYRYEDGRGRYRLVTLTGPGTTKGESGKPWRGVDPTKSGRHWAVPLTALESAYPDKSTKDLSIQERLDLLNNAGLIYWPKRGKIPQQKRYSSEAPGVPIQDICADIRPIGSHAKERLGYATQKPLALLDRIIRASSNEGDVVFDPFCGCATTLEAAHHLKRRWIGIDIAIHAIRRVAQVRLEERLSLKEGLDFIVDGVPCTLEGAHDLWMRDKYHFQKWAIEEVDGFVTTRKTVDGGIDGRLYFDLPGQRELQSMVIEVKGGKNVNISVVRDLRGVLARDDALMAGLIVLEELSDRKRRNFAQEMAQAGELRHEEKYYPKMQLLTVKEILEGKRFNTPYAARGRSIDPTISLLQ